MRWGQFLWVLTVFSAAAPGAAGTPPAAMAHARQLFEHGVSLERAGQYQQAIDVLSQAIRSRALRGEDAARAVFDRGVAFDAQGDTRRAVKDYSAALRLMPRLSAALSNRANVFRRQGRLNEAKKDYLAALRCPGVSSQFPYYGLGLIAEQLGDQDTARDYFQKALAVDPSFALAAQSLSTLEVRHPPSARAITPSPKPVVLSLRAPVRPAASAVRAVSSVALNEPPQARAAPKPPQSSAPPKTADARQSHPSLRLATSDFRDTAGAAAEVQIQLGAFLDEQTALEAWDRIAAGSANLLEGFQPLVTVADIPGRGRFWRLRTEVTDARAGKRLCAALIEKGQACLLVRK